MIVLLFYWSRCALLHESAFKVRLRPTEYLCARYRFIYIVWNCHEMQRHCSRPYQSPFRNFNWMIKNNQAREQAPQINRWWRTDRQAARWANKKKDLRTNHELCSLYTLDTTLMATISQFRHYCSLVILVFVCDLLVLVLVLATVLLIYISYIDWLIISWNKYAEVFAFWPLHIDKWMESNWSKDITWAEGQRSVAEEQERIQITNGISIDNNNSNIHCY